MQLQLNINGVDFSHWLLEDGISFGQTTRQTVEVVTMNGTLYRNAINKNTISVSLVELRDSTLAMLKTALYTNPCAVQATDADGTTMSGQYYVSDLSYSAKTVIGGNTYYSGTSFDLEEQ